MWLTTMDIQKPDSPEKMIEQIWFIIYGANGDGLYGQMKKLRKSFYLYTTKKRFETCPFTQHMNAKNQIDLTKTKSRIEWVKYSISEIMKAMIAVGLFTFIGKSAGFL